MGRRRVKSAARKPRGAVVRAQYGSAQVRVLGAAAVAIGAIVLATRGGTRKFTGMASEQWAPVYAAHVVDSISHSEDAFTQGLVYQDGVLWESTGLMGASRLRKLGLRGGVLAETNNDPNHFGEGLAPWGDGLQMVQLTWRNEVAHVWDIDNGGAPRIVSTFSLPGERWGIARATKDGDAYMLSNGTADIVTLGRTGDLLDLRVLLRITVMDGGRKVRLINDLQMIGGLLYANVWMSPLIARIDPRTGRVHSWVRCDSLQPQRYASAGHNIDWFNGIAYDDIKGRIFVTGKLWPRLYHIEIDETKPVASNVLDANGNPPFFMNRTIVNEIIKSTGRTPDEDEED